MSKPDWAERLQRTFQRKFEAGREFEQERIIEIIERCPRVDDDYMILCDARQLIALIKGEQK
nr:MAG TPA: hypothetical protein [Caudoviricetes sp.]